MDEETGLYYYRARYYDPGIGKFIGQDPIGFLSEHLNLYSYVGNIPASSTDPLGLKDTRKSPIVPSNGSVINNSSNPIIILNSLEKGAYLESLYPGKGTPNSLGRSKDVDGFWTCQNSMWTFYGIGDNASLLFKGGKRGKDIGIPGTIKRFPSNAINLGSFMELRVSDLGVTDKAGNAIPPSIPSKHGGVEGAYKTWGSFAHLGLVIARTLLTMLRVNILMLQSGESQKNSGQELSLNMALMLYAILTGELLEMVTGMHSSH